MSFSFSFFFFWIPIFLPVILSESLGKLPLLGWEVTFIYFIKIKFICIIRQNDSFRKLVLEGEAAAEEEENKDIRQNTIYASYFCLGKRKRLNNNFQQYFQEILVEITIIIIIMSDIFLKMGSEITFSVDWYIRTWHQDVLRATKRRELCTGSELKVPRPLSLKLVGKCPKTHLVSTTD